MNKTLIAGLLGLAPLLAMAGGNDNDSDRKRLDQVLSPAPALNAKDTAALSLARRWQNNPDVASQARAGSDGLVQFLYGAGQPTLVCAVMQVCDVQLQAGERVTALHLGDSVRWMVEPAISGDSSGQVSQHLVLKPLDAGLDTTLLVTTDRRTYHLRLRSTRNEYLARVSFIYADEIEARWAALAKATQLATQQRTLPDTNTTLDELDFDYTISGRAPWKPVRVYNDGTRTTIEMPRSIKNEEAPVIFLVRQTPGVLSSGEQVMVNYRVQGNRYIVDSVFSKAVMVAGVGRNQVKVTLARKR